MTAATTHENVEYVECQWRSCVTTGPKYEFHHGKYCSMDCYYHEKGQRLIDRLDHGSRFCATCYDAIRDIEPAPEHKTPGPDYAPKVTCPACSERFQPDDYERPHTECPECGHGFEYVRLFQPGPQNVADGLQYAKAPLTHGIDAADGDHGYYEFQRESCSCGAVDPNDLAAEIQQIHPEIVRERLFLAVRWLTWTDDDLPVARRGRYTDALSERPHDAAYAVGKSVYGGEG